MKKSRSFARRGLSATRSINTSSRLPRHFHFKPRMTPTLGSRWIVPKEIYHPILSCECVNKKRATDIPKWFGCLANAVAHIHETGIRHRDIKPENILMKGGAVLLADFGISKMGLGQTLSTTVPMWQEPARTCTLPLRLAKEAHVAVQLISSPWEQFSLSFLLLWAMIPVNW